MKSSFVNKILFCLVVTILAATLVFTACSRKKAEVAAPTDLTITNDVLSWSAVPGTLTYDVKIDETVYSTQETTFALPITDYDFHTITVRATTHGGTSEYATPLTYARRAAQTVLPALSSPVISMTSNRVMWSTVLNNNGYLIYMGDSVFTAEKNTTYYDLSFPGDGIYYIRMQTVGDGVTYSNSKISNAYAVTVKDGKAPLQKLPKTEFTFDAATKSLVWSNRYSAAAVSFEIYQEGVALPIETIPADSTKVKMSYKPDLNGGVVSYKMRLISNNGLYNPSDFNDKITFPLAGTAPEYLRISPDSEQGVYLLEWGAVTFSDGYTLELDGEPLDAGAVLSMALPDGLAAGRHVARVKSMGRGIYYADSLYGEGIVFYVNDKGKVTTPLAAPTAPSFNQPEEGVLSVILNEIEGATKYRFTFVGASGENVLIYDKPTFDISDGRLGERRATDEENVVIARILADLPTGITACAVAVPSDPLYVESPRSAETYYTTGDAVRYAAAPDFRFQSGRYEWSDQGEENYEVMTDGVVTDVDDVTALAAGSHVARLRVKAEHALWSKEIFFRTPTDLAIPSNVALNGSILTFVGSENATGYLLYVNGTAVATVLSLEGKINLGNYLTTDGEYVIHLVATSSGDAFADSAPSRQVLYVKDDAAYGTEIKPFLPATAAELWSGMRDNSSAYFRLLAGGEYDFSDIDLAAYGSFTFRGTVMGNGATLKGIRVGSPLFAALEEATIRDLRIEIEGASLSLAQSGLFAKKITDSTISSVAFYLSGRFTSSTDVTFGALCYEATGLTMRDSSIACELNIENSRNIEFAVVADKFGGNLFNSTVSGRVTLTGRDVRCGVLAVNGEMSLSGLDSTLTLTVNATGGSTVAGVTLGSVTGDRVNPKNVISLNAAYPIYYGVSGEGATLVGSTVGGSISAQGSTVEIRGIAQDGALSLSDVKVTTLLKGKATSSVKVAGIAGTLAADAVTSSLSFEGEIDANAPDVEAAGIAATSLGAHTARMSGSITVTGKEARVAAGVLESDALTMDGAGHITLNKVTDAEVGGAALTASGKVTLNGSLTLSATECGEVDFGGAVATGNQQIKIGDYAITGAIAADVIRFGGVAYDAKTIEMSSTGLSVNVTLTSADLKAAGGVLAATQVTFSEPSTLAATLSCTGDGSVYGFGGQIGTGEFSDLTVSGSLSLTGTGTLCGVAEGVGTAQRITSSVDLTAEGDADVYGLFRSVSEASAITLSDATVEIRSDNGKYYGIAGYVMKGGLSDLTISGLTFRAAPLTPGGSMEFYGLTDDVKTLTGVTLTGATYTVGAYEELSFYGLAEQLTEGMSESTISYLLHSDAALSEIGGGFRRVKGDLSFDLGTANAPLTIEATGRVRVGGLALEANDITMTNFGARVALALALPAESESAAGGLFAEIEGAYAVSFTDASAEVSLRRTGAGSLTFGGVAATCYGALSGAKVTLDVVGGRAEDVYGGVVGTLTAGRFSNGSAYGNLSTAGAVGGLVGVASYGFLEGGATAMKITSTGQAGGLFATATGCVVRNVYSVSRLTDKGAGLFAEGENLTITNGYFAGSAAEYSLAGRAINCALSFFLLDATLAGSSGVPAVGEGSLDYETASLAYGYAGETLGDDFRVDGKRYPYAKDIGPFPENTSLTARALPTINVTESADLYSLLPRFYDAATPTITWIDATGLLSIEQGMATVSDNGSGTLYGVLSGGVRVYTVYYIASGFVPLVGEGTAESPFLIRDIKYLRYVKTYAEEFPTAHFRLDLEEESVTGAELPTLFIESEPFRGTMDFGGVLFLSPVLPEEGILGYLDGATVKGLSLGGDLGGVLLALSVKDSTIEDVTISDASLSGEVTLVGTVTGSAITGVTVVGDCASALNFRLVGAMTESTLRETSLSLSFNTGEAVSVCLIDTATASDISGIQVLLRSSVVGELNLSPVREDDGSVYDSCMMLADVRSSDPAESRVAGLAFLANGTTFRNCAVILSAEDVEVSPLIAEGTATYEDTVLLTTAAVIAPTGVTLATPANAHALIGALTGYVEGTLPTPLGYALFGEESETDFTLSEEAVTLYEVTEIADLTTVDGVKPFATLVSYSFTGGCAVIEGNALRPKADGVGTLTFTNLYGVSRSLEVTVEGFDGFAKGSGTEEDPYLIANTTDFLRMLQQDDGSVYYLLTTDLTDVTIEESAQFGGVLTSAHHTVEIDLVADSFLEEGSGTIEGVNFVLTKDALEVESLGGLFAKSFYDMTLRDCEITLNCPSVTIGDEATFGLLVGSAENETRIEEVILSVGTVEIAAGQDAYVGVLCGSANDTFIVDVTVSGEVSLSATGAVYFGAVGVILATSETHVVYDELTESEEISYYVERVSLDLTLTATGDELTMGGFAGQSGVTIVDLDGDVELTVGGGRVNLGGAVGISYAEIKNVALTSEITTSSAVLGGYVGGYVGGIAGRAGSDLSGGTVSATIDVLAEGELYVGGAVGYGDGVLEDLRITADITARSIGAEEQVESLRDPESDDVILLSVGGAAGRLSSDVVSRVSVTVVRVQASSDYVGDDLSVLAGGLGGKVYAVRDVEVKGEGTVSATGGRALSAGAVAMLGGDLARVVISGVSVTGDGVYGAIGVCYREDGEVRDLFTAITLSDETPAVIGVMNDGTTVTHARYLSGQAISTGETESLTDVQKLATVDAFCSSSLYTAFDGEIWNIAGDAIPSLR